MGVKFLIKIKLNIDIWRLSGGLDGMPSSGLLLKKLLEQISKLEGAKSLALGNFSQVLQGCFGSTTVNTDLGHFHAGLKVFDLTCHQKSS